MDVTLTRILSLLPHENGKIKRGSQKTFAQSIGYGSGDIVSMWINGTSQSYKKKLHQIADEYHVSVAWLKGETDDPTVEAEGIKKAPDPKIEGLSADELRNLVQKTNDRDVLLMVLDEVNKKLQELR
jgi:hypothetical protein